jgi:hypothetical protein
MADVGAAWPALIGSLSRVLARALRTQSDLWMSL